MNKIITKKQYADNKYYEVELYYSKGGYSYYTYTDVPRGYYVSVTPVTYEDRQPSGFTSRSFMMFSGLKNFIQPANRFSKKVFDSIVIDESLIDKMIQAIATKENLPLPISIPV